MAFIHPSAVISDETELGENVEIGPRCTLAGRVRLGDGVRLLGDVYVQGPVTIGADTIVYPFACLGFPGQDVKFKPGDPTPGVVVGSNCTLREHVTIHSATHKEIPTTIGDRVFMMVNAHAAHDTRVGNDVTMVNNSCLGGHVTVADRVTLGGSAAVHQFVRVGRLAFIGGLVPATCDVPPFALLGYKNEISSLNLIGMRRAGYSNDEITLTRRAYREVFRTTVPRERMLEILDEIGSNCAPVAEIAAFIRTATRPLCHGSQSRQSAAFSTN